MVASAAQHACACSSAVQVCGACFLEWGVLSHLTVSPTGAHIHTTTPPRRSPYCIKRNSRPDPWPWCSCGVSVDARGTVHTIATQPAAATPNSGGGELISESKRLSYQQHWRKTFEGVRLVLYPRGLTRHGCCCSKKRRNRSSAPSPSGIFLRVAKDRRTGMRQKTWPTLPQKMQVDSGIHQADRPYPSTTYGQLSGRFLLSFFSLVHPTQCERAGTDRAELGCWEKEP